jgi:hypothetical protein
MPYQLHLVTPREAALRALLAPYGGVSRAGFHPSRTKELRRRLLPG